MNKKKNNKKKRFFETSFSVTFEVQIKKKGVGSGPPIILKIKISFIHSFLFIVFSRLVIKGFFFRQRSLNHCYLKHLKFSIGNKNICNIINRANIIHDNMTFII